MFVTKCGKQNCLNCGINKVLNFGVKKWKVIVSELFFRKNEPNKVKHYYCDLQKKVN